MDNAYIEVVVKKVRVRFKATTSLFPSCKGYGKTEEEASLKLVKLIAKHVAKVTEESLKKIIVSGYFTEVIISGSEAKQQYTKVFPVSPTLMQLQQAVLLRIRAKQLPKSMLDKLNKDKASFFDGIDQSTVYATHSPKIGETTFSKIPEESTHNQDNFIVGFPLSLN